MGAFTITFLGTGTSAGIPMIGCDCAVCHSADPRDRRLRPSAYVAAGDLRILIDTSPDFREQALTHRIRRVDAVLVTHAHVDHLFGLDDIRRINTVQGGSIPLYAAAETLADIRRIFDYAFREPMPGTHRPELELRETAPTFILGEGQGGVSVTPVPVVHGRTATCGYRLDYGGHSLAYIPDCHELPAESARKLAGLDLLAIDTLKFKPHTTHLSFDEALAIVGQLRPRRALLTHLCHDISHEAALAELRRRGIENVAPAYDGLVEIVK